MPPTVLYLVRHGATDANLAIPPYLLGRRLDPSLAPLGIRQAKATRDVLAGIRIASCFTSPLLRCQQTATILCEPHGLTPHPLDALAECDLGRWEGLDWQTIAEHEPEAYQRFVSDPARVGHPGGESYQDVFDRAWPLLEELFTAFPEQNLLVVSHQVVIRTYWAWLLGLPLGQARQLTVANVAVLRITRQENTTVNRMRLHMMRQVTPSRLQNASVTTMQLGLAL
jgi:broad specificity phosphatase PhoE